MRKLLNTAPTEILVIKLLTHHKLIPIDLFGGRGYVINKAMPLIERLEFSNRYPLLPAAISSNRSTPTGSSLSSGTTA
jgi:hypothetical protein